MCLFLLSSGEDREAKSARIRLRSEEESSFFKKKVTSKSPTHIVNSSFFEAYEKYKGAAPYALHALIQSSRYENRQRTWCLADTFGLCLKRANISFLEAKVNCLILGLIIHACLGTF